ncbi:alpha/beta-hydrolase [Tricholoma matsutake]|nr:alpha/beta-hydrolase [Tricholoma matsutake 945]
MYTEAWLPGPQTTQFYTRTYNTTKGDAKAVIVFIHGFAEHVGRYTHFHLPLAEHGIAVFAFDLRGFGKTALDTEGHKSKDSTYGKTSWLEQMADIEWALGHAKEAFPRVPVFLAGHSMGAAEVLGFVTQGEKSSRHAMITSLAGVITTSPLIEQATPASRLLRWAGGKASTFAPHMLIPAPVNSADLSHDPKFNDAYAKDPLIKAVGTLRGLHDMLSHGEALLQSYYLNWPESLPVLLIHGTEDKVSLPSLSLIIVVSDSPTVR